MNKLEKAAKALENAVVALEDLPDGVRWKSLLGVNMNNTEYMRKEAIHLYELSQATKQLSD